MGDKCVDEILSDFESRLNAVGIFNEAQEHNLLVGVVDDFVEKETGISTMHITPFRQKLNDEERARRLAELNPEGLVNDEE